MKKTKKILSLVLLTMLIIVATLLISSAKGSRDWKWPVPASNSISSCYLDGRAHYALDIPAGQGSSIYASYPGTVIATYTGCSHNYGKNSSCGCGGGLGNYVYIKHTYQGTNYVSRYGHMTAVKVSVGASVTKDTIIGTVGTTGYSTGNHLDFRIYKGSSTSHTASTAAIDPFKEEFLEMPSGFRSTATTSCCSTYVNEVKALYAAHTHSYLSHYEADHPHRVYNKCSCGDWYYTGGTQYLSSCSQCNEPTKIVYPTDGGIYKIASGVGNNMYLDFHTSSNNVQIYENCDGNSNPAWVKSQYFKLTHVGDGWYTITNPANGKAMDVYDWRTASGTNIQQWDLHSGDCQLFRFYDAGNGYCYIKSKLGTYVDVANGDAVNNTNVWAYAFNGSNAQKWKIQTHSHSYSSTVTTSATCTKTGVKTFTCYCGVSYTETIAKTAHNKNTTIPAVSATCTKSGLTEGKKCSACGTVTVAQQTVAKKAHSYTSSVTTQPTCTKEGVKTYKCSGCTASYTEAIAKKSHTIVVVPAVAATCTKTGLTEGKKCSACGTVTVAQTTINATGHKDNNFDGKCDNCGVSSTTPSDPTPEEPTKDCSCNCHKGGLAGLLFKIINFFQKLFGMNKVCDCGVAHY